VVALLHHPGLPDASNVRDAASPREVNSAMPARLALGL
jgi:hypothetical protein